MKKKTSLTKQCLLAKNANYIVNYIKDDDFITVYYMDGSSKQFFNTRENEIKIIKDMQNQARDLEEVLKKCDIKHEFWSTLNWVSFASFFGYMAAYGSSGQIDAKRETIALAWYGSWMMITALKSGQYSTPAYDLEKVKYFITHGEDINSDYAPNQLRFDKRGLPINGYHRYTINDIDNLSLKELKIMAEQNQERRLQKRA